MFPKVVGPYEEGGFGKPLYSGSSRELFAAWVLNEETFGLGQKERRDATKASALKRSQAQVLPCPIQWSLRGRKSSVEFHCGHTQEEETHRWKRFVMWERIVI